MIELSEEQRRAVRAHPDEPLQLVDSSTQSTFVLLSTDLFDRIKGLVYDDSDFSITEAYPLLDRMASQAGWDRSVDGHLQRLRS